MSKSCIYESAVSVTGALSYGTVGVCLLNLLPEVTFIEFEMLLDWAATGFKGLFFAWNPLLSIVNGFDYALLFWSVNGFIGLIFESCVWFESCTKSGLFCAPATIATETHFWLLILSALDIFLELDYFIPSYGWPPCSPFSLEWIVRFCECYLF